MTVEMCALRKPAQNASNVFTIYIEWVPLLEGTVILKFYKGTFHLFSIVSEQLFLPFSDEKKKKKISVLSNVNEIT